MATIFNKTKNSIITKNLIIAKGFHRLKGLMFRENMQDSEVLMIPYTNSIHTFFMNFSIDVVFMDSENCVKKIIVNLKPNKIIWPVLSANKVLEFKSGAIDRFKIEVGDTLNVES